VPGAHWIRAHRQPGILILLGNDQDGFTFHHVKPVMLGGQYLSGRDPDVGSIRRELTKNQCTAGQIIGCFWEKFELHSVLSIETQIFADLRG
jgi:hypothetical protein